MGCVNPLVELAHQKFLERHHQSLLEAGATEGSAAQSYMRIFAEQAPGELHRHNGSGADHNPKSPLPVLPVDALSIATRSQFTPFPDWWTWCQKCKHGGHAAHLARWFETHDSCHVSDCSCSCGSLHNFDKKCLE